MLIAALLGLAGATDPVFVAAWVAIVFVSILVHELGHALTARSFGANVEIELNGIGGLTRWSMPSDELGPGRRALVAAAGSAVGVLFGGAIWLVVAQFGPYRGLGFFVVNNLVFVNVFWGLLNWLPIRPLDGGHLLLSLLEKFAPSRGEAIARGVFLMTAAGGLAYGIMSDRIFIALIAGWLLLGEFGGIRSREAPVPIPEFSYDDPAEERGRLRPGEIAEEGLDQDPGEAER